jgi:hypothetical protein
MKNAPTRWIVLIAVLLSGCERAPAPEADALDAARSFYLWYQAPVESAGASGSFQRAIEQRPATFGADLRAALEADLAASKADPDYIVGLDFDPFTASQDPCERYAPDSVTVLGATVRIAVVEHCSAATSRGVPLTIEMREEDGAWRITDIEFADGYRLSEVLARLKASRDSTRAPTA